MPAANTHTDSGQRPLPPWPLNSWPLIGVLLLACACASDAGQERGRTAFDKGAHCESEKGTARVLIEVRPDHFRAANKRLHDAIQSDAGLARRLGLTEEQVAALPTSRKPPVGHTWHHHQDVGRMQLITDSAHELAKPHTGGMAIWG